LIKTSGSQLRYKGIKRTRINYAEFDILSAGRFCCLFTPLILSWLDYACVTLTGNSRRLLDWLQSVLYAAARLV